jgi:hypothetical protein
MGQEPIVGWSMSNLEMGALSSYCRVKEGRPEDRPPSVALELAHSAQSDPLPPQTAAPSGGHGSAAVNLGSCLS